MMHQFSRIKTLSSLAILLASLSLPAAAVEVSGVKIDDTAKVGGKELKLNGAGVRTKVIVKVYVAGLYLADKKTTAADILALPGPKRIQLVMLREVSSEDFGESFMTGMNANSDKAEKSKIVNQTVKFGEMFASIPALKKGDVITTDWIPESGTLIQLNGQKIVDVLPDVAFFNALLKIWLGEKPADSSLKAAMLGGKP